MRAIAASLILLALTACQQETRTLRTRPPRLGLIDTASRESTLQPGGSQAAPEATNPYEGNRWAISEGQRWFTWYNCVGCHANGGGGMGPPLIKTAWLYGNTPGALFNTIAKGRPNGMPAWGGRIPEDQIWQIVAYVTSLNQSGLSDRAQRTKDTLETDSSTIRPGPEERH